MVVVSCFEIGLSQAVQHEKDRGLFLTACISFYYHLLVALV